MTMKDAMKCGRYAHFVREQSKPGSVSPGIVQPPFLRINYDTFADFQHGLQRDYRLMVGPEFARHFEGPKEIGVSGNRRLYLMDIRGPIVVALTDINAPAPVMNSRNTR